MIRIVIYFLFVASACASEAIPEKPLERFKVEIPKGPLKNQAPTITVIIANVGFTPKTEERIRVLNSGVVIAFADYEKIVPSATTMAMTSGHQLLVTLVVPAPMEGLNNSILFQDTADAERLAPWKKLGPPVKGFLLSYGYYGDEKTLRPTLEYAAKENFLVVFPEPHINADKICSETKTNCLVGHFLITQKDDEIMVKKKLEIAENMSKTIGHATITIHVNDSLFDEVLKWLESLKSKNINLKKLVD
jgi:polysaccharide deacetylase 2 family uncharacterized protein YibQ